MTLLFSFMSRPYYSGFKSAVIFVTLLPLRKPYYNTWISHNPIFYSLKKTYVTLLAFFFLFFFFFSFLVISGVVGFQIFQSLFCILTLTKLQAPRQNELSATHS